MTNGLLDLLINALLGPETKRLTKVLTRLLVDNNRLGGSRDCFLHDGKVYSTLTPKQLRGVEVRPIRRELLEEVERLHQDWLRLETDTRRLRQGLAVVLSKCRSRQDVRDVLPEVLVEETSLRELPREREEGFLLAEHPMLHAQYQKAIEIALYYTANKLIY